MMAYALKLVSVSTAAMFASLFLCRPFRSKTEANACLFFVVGWDTQGCPKVNCRVSGGRRRGWLGSTRSNPTSHNYRRVLWLRRHLRLVTTVRACDIKFISGSAGARSGYRPDPKTARDKFYVASSDSRDQAQMASEPENPTVVVGGWIGASRTQSAATATAGDATKPLQNYHQIWLKTSHRGKTLHKVLA